MARTPRQPTTHQLDPIKGSRFIANLAPVTDEPSARAFVRQIEAQMPDANHHCWALRLARPAVERAVDAGEPSGSAGRPILAAMTGRDVEDACLVVSRYFGGTKLGVGGLVRAYGGAAAAVLEDAEWITRVETETWTLEYGYEDGAAIERALVGLGLEPGQVEYGASVRRAVRIPVEHRDAATQSLRDSTAGRIRMQREPTEG